MIARKGSWIKTIQIAITGYLLHYVLLSTVTAGNCYYVYPLALMIAYPLGAGITLGFTNVPYLNIPKQDGTIYIAFYSTASNGAAFLGVAVGRAIMRTTEGVTLNVLGIPMINKQFYLLLVAALMLTVVVCIFFFLRYLKKRQLEC